MPQIQVGIEEHSFDDTARAVRIVVGLQRTSSVPLQTTVTSVQQAIDSSKSAILIAADGWNHADIVLPVSAGPGGPITINAVKSDGKPATLTLDPALRFASLQTVFQHGRSLLVATSNGAPNSSTGFSGGSMATAPVGPGSGAWRWWPCPGKTRLWWNVRTRVRWTTRHPSSVPARDGFGGLVAPGLLRPSSAPG
ncbi:hypothetical protein I551_7628 [Mycobacterium ulcerans str. Harvey]|uniref:Uncharacterized protein n=1 Tax=Mycobacterium ulcerans str. Harvey TaxID=1299332 RepID=A0ABN0QMN1_MYCUL|nr:hypothetical protein I551_7628 [Mycobacterium ulcerans str. Harvey]